MAQNGMKQSTIIICCVAIASLSLGALIGLVLHFTIREEPLPPGPRNEAVGNCIPQGDITKELCDRRGCIWREPTDGAPWCTFPPGYGYSVDGDIEETSRGYRVNLIASQQGEPLYGGCLEKIRFEAELQTDSRIRLKFLDPEENRYQVPQEAVDIESPEAQADNETRLYDVEFQEEPHFGVKVLRRSSGTAVFNVTVPGLTFCDQYIQISNRLPSGHFYGLGEHNHQQFKHDMNWRNWTIFTRDEPPVEHWNLYGAQPFYMNVEEDGNSNGILLLNSNAMDIVLQPPPYPAITYHVIGGILDFYVFLGPTPENVVQQYTEAVGRPFMPPYWALGFQLSRWGYTNLTHVEMVVNRTRLAGIPQDVQYGDIDYMESKLDFTYDKERFGQLPQFIDDLHSKGQKYIIILDHCIGSNETLLNITVKGDYPPYYDGVKNDVFIRDPRNAAEHLKGEVWPGESVFPDFTSNRTASWWSDQCHRFYRTDDIKYDALWIDMNEPSNFVQGSTTGCSDSPVNNPPYLPNVRGGLMYDKTICMDADQVWGLHYDVHSLYGHSMSMATWQTLKDLQPVERPLVLTRSTYVGTQKYAGHWLGDNQSKWPHLHWSIVGMLEFSLFGFSYTGADICGFWYEATEDMCMRWTQLGAFYPFSRNHNGETWPDQDPAAFGEPMIRIARDILMIRYKLLPYLYTLFHEAHVVGSTVVRPLMHEFISDRNTWHIDTQFLWGPGLLITPVLTEGATVVECYFPNARWYDFYEGKDAELRGVKKNISAPLDYINLHVRGGYIIPWQEPNTTTHYSRDNNMGVIVALGDAPLYEARGSLFWDDGTSYETFEEGEYLLVNFTTKNYKLHFDVINAGYNTTLIFDTIHLWGLLREPVWFIVNGVLHSDWEYNPFTKSVSLSRLGLPIADSHTVEWDLTE